MIQTLTPGQLRVLELVADGGHTRDIAKALRRSESTVKQHLAEIYAKLEARGQAHAVAIAFRRGWLA